MKGLPDSFSNGSVPLKFDSVNHLRRLAFNLILWECTFQTLKFDSASRLWFNWTQPLVVFTFQAQVVCVFQFWTPDSPAPLKFWFWLCKYFVPFNFHWLRTRQTTGVSKLYFSGQIEPFWLFCRWREEPWGFQVTALSLVSLSWKFWIASSPNSTEILN